MIDYLNPAWVYLLGALGMPLVKKQRAAYLLAVPVVAGLFWLLLPMGNHLSFDFMGRQITMIRADALSRLFGLVFILASFAGALYGLHEKHRTNLWMAAFFYVGGSLSVVYAGDLITLFIFSELMAFSSLCLIIFEGSDKALKAGFRYILVHIFAGVCMVGGIAIHAVKTGSIAFDGLGVSDLGGQLILVGFMVNAAVPPLSAWLSDAYPEATIVGAVFLSAFTTKTAVYCLMRGFAGVELLAWMGAIMTLYGVGYAMLENDIRRLLSFHIISQVGYMVAGAGMGSHLAVNGAGAHAFTHILYKGLLFMGAGAVIHSTGLRKQTDLGGVYKFMPITMTLYMIGAFSISAFPLFSGFVSKSMIVAAAEHQHLTAIYLMLNIASAGTFLSVGLKLPYYTFFHREWRGEPVKEAPSNMLAAMVFMSVLCIGIGVFPGPLYALLPNHPVHFESYTPWHVVGSLQLLLFTGLGFFVLLRFLTPHTGVSLDTEWFYRKGFYYVGRQITSAVYYLDTVMNTLYLSGFAAVKRISKSGRWTDVNVVDGAVNEVGRFFKRTSEDARRMQSGLLRGYAFTMVVAFVLIAGYYLFGGR
ncbi:MAG: Na(+)/H(+) antiporter subunit D [Nitrospinae bacterium]|nr:Na(+)/H(+) antiporter subunit D [Nitrospinota bacterium]